MLTAGIAGRPLSMDDAFVARPIAVSILSSIGKLGIRRLLLQLVLLGPGQCEDRFNRIWSKWGTFDLDCRPIHNRLNRGFHIDLGRRVRVNSDVVIDQPRRGEPLAGSGFNMDFALSVSCQFPRALRWAEWACEEAPRPPHRMFGKQSQRRHETLARLGGRKRVPGVQPTDCENTVASLI